MRRTSLGLRRNDAVRTPPGHSVTYERGVSPSVRVQSDDNLGPAISGAQFLPPFAWVNASDCSEPVNRRIESKHEGYLMMGLLLAQRYPRYRGIQSNTDTCPVPVRTHRRLGNLSHFSARIYQKVLTGHCVLVVLLGLDGGGCPFSSTSIWDHCQTSQFKGCVAPLGRRCCIRVCVWGESNAQHCSVDFSLPQFAASPTNQLHSVRITTGSSSF